MTKKIVVRAMSIGRATVFAVGLAMILAVVLGVASSALAANGKPFLLGGSNVATKVSSLVNKGVGPALGLKVAVDQAPLTVNPEAGIAVCRMFWEKVLSLAVPVYRRNRVYWYETLRLHVAGDGDTRWESRWCLALRLERRGGSLSGRRRGLPHRDKPR